MNRLTTKCDVVIVGSGFGATVAATTVAAAAPGLRIHVLERGVHWESRELVEDFDPPTQFFAEPDNWTGLPAFLSLLAKGPSSRPTRQQQPLYHYSAFDDVHIVTASGVGGGSLIYSNVSLPPFRDPVTGEYPVIASWPLHLNDSHFEAAAAWMATWRGPTSRIVTSVPLPSELAPYIEDLSNVPGTTAGDYEYLYLGRSNALRRGSKSLQLPAGIQAIESWKPVPLQVLEHVLGRPDEYQSRRFCERQSRCILGCTPGSMNTLARSLSTLLTMHTNVFVEPLTDVKSIRLAGEGYLVECVNLSTGDATSFEAPTVVLGAGTLGTNEILLRSQRNGLVLSTELGRGFSTNGDFSAFVDKIPFSFLGKWVMPTKGPINSSSARFFSDKDVWMTIEDAGIPKMFARLVRLLLDGLGPSSTSGSRALGQELRTALSDFDTAHLLRILSRDAPFADGDDGVIKDVFWFNCMGNDSIPGQFGLKGDALQLTYPNGKPVSDRVYAAIESVLRAFSAAMGGAYIPFPTWEGFFHHKLMCTHPLGGCRIGYSSSDGVVDLQGRVFNTPSGTSSVYDGLYVMDGSVLPGPVGANPTLTIVALALIFARSLTSFVRTRETDWDGSRSRRG